MRSRFNQQPRALDSHNTPNADRKLGLLRGVCGPQSASVGNLRRTVVVPFLNRDVLPDIGLLQSVALGGFGATKTLHDQTAHDGSDSKDGKLLWTVKAKSPVLGAVTIENGIAYIGASDSTFRAIDIHTGKVIWAYTGVKGYIETKPLVTADKVIFGAWDNTLYALNKADGKELWKWTGGLTRMHFSPAAVWPVTAEGKVFITDPQRAMTAINIENGETVWRTFQSMVRETIGLSEDGTRVFSKTMNDSIVCYATQGDQPRELWASNVGFGYEHAPSMQVEKGGVMFGSTKEGLIFALEAQTGKVLWKHKIGNSLINTVVPLNGQQVLFTATSGEVGLLRVKN